MTVCSWSVLCIVHFSCVLLHLDRGMRVIHVSGDKDMWQLIASNVFVSDIYSKYANSYSCIMLVIGTAVL